MAEKPLDYYGILEVPQNATQEQIRTAYKKAALKWHPDRVPSDSPERQSRTKKFQQVNDAYFTLSDAGRRRDYDAARQWDSADTASDFADEEIPHSSKTKQGGNGWGSWFGGFGSSAKDGAAGFGEQQWSSAFEEMMKDADMGEDETVNGEKKTKPTGRFWSVVGMVSGAALGTIVGNVTGMVAGGLGGMKLGAIRDTHGKSVYAVFQDLPQQQKARVLSELAAKIFAQAVSG